MTSDRRLSLELAPELLSIENELLIYERLLARWQRSINLVSNRDAGHLWRRHFADSAQVLRMAPHAAAWLDLGSGGGFPGMVVALLLKSRAGAKVHLVESDQRKAAFLRAVSRETAAPTEIHVGRIEDVIPRLPPVDAVSARALAPLPKLIRLARPALDAGAIGVFLKGADWRKELTDANRPDNLVLSACESRTDKRASVVLVKAGESLDRRIG
ncbi:MAG: 16S rRNA (guanine(527)-N(7))-methyltransferase RsmG [Methylocystis sp.]|nr:16S rRNA (guanine(527)-N(7))-methyltransferase RsmG [Methylocystis sp.]